MKKIVLIFVAIFSCISIDAQNYLVDQKVTAVHGFYNFAKVDGTNFNGGTFALTVNGRVSFGLGFGNFKVSDAKLNLVQPYIDIAFIKIKNESQNQTSWVGGLGFQFIADQQGNDRNTAQAYVFRTGIAGKSAQNEQASFVYSLGINHARTRNAFGQKDNINSLYVEIGSLIWEKVYVGANMEVGQGLFAFGLGTGLTFGL